MIGKLTLTGLALGLLLLSCTAPPASAPAPGASAPLTAPAKSGWEQDWQKTLAAAGKEGALNIYTPAGADTRMEISKSFKTKYGLDIEWTVGRTAEVAEKVSAERRMGLFTADFGMAAMSWHMTVSKPGGMLDPIKPLLVLPEVMDKTLWFDGEIPWVDNEKMYAINPVLGPVSKLVINTSMVKPGEITSWNDLLDPRWKGKLVFANPVLQTGNFTQIALLTGSVDYWSRFARNEPVIVDDDRTGVEWLARGKYPVTIVGRVDVVEEFVRAGAPIEVVVPKKERAILGGGAISVVMFNRAPHPNAARVFANWFLTKETGAMLSRLTGVQSARLDVPANDLAPGSVRDPSAKYVITESEDYFQQVVKDRELAREIFGSDGRGRR
ncbi:MAG: extracellular solute-binding protein [Chloroflexi bacterium]|nr:extracellular solute-binding protein [Chloroflexota bacterium]